MYTLSLPLWVPPFLLIVVGILLIVLGSSTGGDYGLNLLPLLTGVTLIAFGIGLALGTLI